MNYFFSALIQVIQPINLFMTFIGALFGILVGAMPGLSSVMGLAILAPFTIKFGGLTGILMLLGIFCGAIYGGSITAILINTPGTANSAATCLDGYPMSRRQPGRALSISTTSSTFGGIFSAMMLFLTAPMLAKVALKFGGPEYFALGIFGISMVTGISSKSVLKGLISGAIGLAMATVGINALTGVPRYTFGTTYLMGGISYIPLLIGVYALAQALTIIEDSVSAEKIDINIKLERIFPAKSDLKRIFPTILGSSIIGTVIGAIPGTGGDIASWFGYTQAKRFSKNPEEFGKGVPEGIAAPEAANNAISGGALIPLLTLGIPGDAGTAVMLGALMMQGIIPSPLLFENQTLEVYTIIIGLIFANIFMAILGFGGIKMFSKIASMPNEILTPIIFVFTSVGAYAMGNDISDIFFMIIAGVIGFILMKLDFAMPPMILGLILGPIIEKNLQKSLVISDGSFMIFVQRPISLGLLIVSILSLLLPVISQYIKKQRTTNV